MILAGSAHQAELVSVCSVKECAGMIWLLQCGTGIAALVFRFSLKVQNSHFRGVGDSREWESDFREGDKCEAM